MGAGGIPGGHVQAYLVATMARGESHGINFECVKRFTMNEAALGTFASCLCVDQRDL